MKYRRRLGTGNLSSIPGILDIGLALSRHQAGSARGCQVTADPQMAVVNVLARHRSQVIVAGILVNAFADLLPAHLVVKFAHLALFDRPGPSCRRLPAHLAEPGVLLTPRARLASQIAEGISEQGLPFLTQHARQRPNLDIRGHMQQVPGER
jgi:hypothetical protein